MSVKEKKKIKNINYHVVWIPKYRSSILVGYFKTKIEIYLYEKAKELNIILEKCMVMPDHVHLFIRCHATQSIAEIVRQLKGYSSYKLRKECPKYRNKYKHFWASGYYCETIGHISEETIKKYINNQ